MKFSIIVHSAPFASEGAHSALRFCEALLAEGHDIYRLFFFRDGVHNLTSLTVVGQDEFNLADAWQKLIAENRLEAVACVTSALKRGVVDEQESRRYEKDVFNLASPAQIGGLGQLVDAIQNSDRVLSFG